MLIFNTLDFFINTVRTSNQQFSFCNENELVVKTESEESREVRLFYRKMNLLGMGRGGGREWLEKVLGINEERRV